MRRLLWLAPVIGAVSLSAVLLSVNAAPDGKPIAGRSDLKTVTTLPISRVILFSSGVAHFARSGEIEGDARVDLTFPEQDINDLIKSMVLQDFSEKGRVSAVTYDSRDPIDRTLRSFAINLNNNPTFGAILNQARGEKVEVVMQQNAVGAPGTVSGTIMGVEHQKVASKDGGQDIEILNLWCQEGVRNIKLNETQRIRFMNPILENEMRRALETLALSHDSQKKAVSLNFNGEGKRKVQVGYVIENPIWKTSYRLVLDKQEKPFLQGWAVVENPTDEDWNSVEMALISGRPISFKMDLYNPLYIGRPTVEPELFASLRPPTYSGAIAQFKQAEGQGQPLANLQQKKAGGRGGFGGGAKGEALADEAAAETESFRRSVATARDRKFANQLGENMNERMNLGAAVNSVAHASQLGDYFQYVIDQPVSLGRQKSALLPIINKDVDGQRVSIYNPNVQAKHPLLGLKFKNTSGMHLSQGPITVFEGSTYAGDTRVLDLQPGEERLVSYAIDQGTEVSVKNGNFSNRITKVKATKGIIYTETLIREEKVYDISNRSTMDRIVLLEHPNRKGQGFAFVGDNKPVEEAADVFRFQVSLGSKKDTGYTVREERTQGASVTLTNNADNQIRFFINLNEASPKLKGKLQQALKVKEVWDNTRRDIGTLQVRINTITRDQDRLRQNLREFPKDSDIYKEYLAKFTKQEKEMTELDTKLADLQKKEGVDRVAYETFLSNISD
jgi:hypothetical protein